MSKFKEIPLKRTEKEIKEFIISQIPRMTSLTNKSICIHLVTTKNMFKELHVETFAESLGFRGEQVTRTLFFLKRYYGIAIARDNGYMRFTGLIEIPEATEDRRRSKSSEISRADKFAAFCEDLKPSWMLLLCKNWDFKKGEKLGFLSYME